MTRTNRPLFVFAILAAIVATDGHAANTGGTPRAPNAGNEQYAWGEAGSRKAATRTVDISMSDAMRFTPDALEFARGETVRLRVTNRGKLMHELVIGTVAELDAHAELMRKFPGMKHHEPYMVHVPPGKTGEIVWKFSRAGQFRFACLIAGHYQAGMTGNISVSEPR